MKNPLISRAGGRGTLYAMGQAQFHETAVSRHDARGFFP
jgi:hypothetical protein